VRSTPLTCRRTYHRKDDEHNEEVRRHANRGSRGSRADSKSFFENDDRPRVSFTRIQPRVVRGHGRGFPRPHHPSPSTRGYGADHNLVPTPPHTFDSSLIGSSGGTPANRVTSSPKPTGLARGGAAAAPSHRSSHSFPDSDANPGILDLHPSLAIQAFLTGLRLSRFFWSLIERPPATLPETLQRAHQYMAAETLVAGKRDETKRPRVEQPRGHPPPPKRREDRSGMLPTRPPPIPLNSTRTEIFFQIRERGLLKAPNPMKSHPERHDKRRYYRFHKECGHDTKECHDLQYQIEDLIQHGHLRRYVRDQSSLPDRRPPRGSSPQPKGPVEKQINVIFGGPASGGNSSSARKAYVRSEVGTRLLHNEDLDVTFKSGGEDSHQRTTPSLGARPSTGSRRSFRPITGS
ncbi:hypothetical protein B296_00050378, partial [Ensete ventricosum]